MHTFSFSFLILLTNVLSKTKKEKLEHCGSPPPGTGIVLINPSANRLLLEEGGQSTASQALVSPTRLKIMCLHRVVWHSSFQVALKFLSELGVHIFFHFAHCSKLAAVISEVM